LTRNEWVERVLAEDDAALEIGFEVVDGLLGDAADPVLGEGFVVRVCVRRPGNTVRMG
jgi:hypothetical protein